MRWLALALVAVLARAADKQVESTIEGLGFNSDDRLSSHLVVYNDACSPQLEAAWARGGHQLRNLINVRDMLADALFGTNHKRDECQAACLEKGTHRLQATMPLPHQTYSGSVEGVHTLFDECQKAELGFIQYLDQQSLKIFWVDTKGQRTQLGLLGYGEKKTQWHHTHLGHRFEVWDAEQAVASFVVEHNGVVVVGKAPELVPSTQDYTNGIKRTLGGEWGRHNVVKRTFTELGFNKGRLPDDLWGSISAFYYNNKNMSTREEWRKDALYVNHWEVDVEFVPMPWKLKTYWQARLQNLVEEWIGGVPLEKTDIYGMRKYMDGARLLTHVDREATHAASLIVNVEQGGLRTPWPLEIYDHGNRLHEIYMEPGDIVYYESARCLHGRQQALDGGYFVNLFAHYRPVGDPQWYLKPNPEGTPKALVDIGDCSKNTAGKVTCTGPPGWSDSHSEPFELPTLSPHLETLTGPDSLFDWWERTTVPASPKKDEL